MLIQQVFQEVLLMTVPQTAFFVQGSKGSGVTVDGLMDKRKAPGVDED